MLDKIVTNYRETIKQYPSIEPLFIIVPFYLLFLCSSGSNLVGLLAAGTVTLYLHKIGVKIDLSAIANDFTRIIKKILK